MSVQTIQIIRDFLLVTLILSVLVMLAGPVFAQDVPTDAAPGTVAPEKKYLKNRKPHHHFRIPNQGRNPLLKVPRLQGNRQPRQQSP